MNIEKAYKISMLINEREKIRVMTENVEKNEVIKLEYNKPLCCGNGVVYIHNGQELFNLIVDHYKKELAKIDEEIENL